MKILKKCITYVIIDRTIRSITVKLYYAHHFDFETPTHI